jgi:phage FluMu gp28-like protein
VKSRQIGATTHTIAWKALKRAVRTGYPQIFLSASKRQVQVFNQSIRKLAQEHLQLELQGSKEQIPLHRAGKPWGGFIFLSTNAATAQSYSGDVYIDEACWIPRFEQLERVASGMATLKHFRKAYVSTPSTVAHPAWAIWKGQTGKDGQPKPDTIRRFRTTVHDAVAGGNDLIDVELLKSEYSDEAFAQLFLCQPIDDEQSVFRLAQLERCQSDPEDWQPVGRAPVWIGYDPSRSRDFACLAVVARVGERWRLVTREKWRDKSFRWQAAQIKACLETYNVERIAIDVTGMGQAVYELVREFFSRVTPLTYTLETKTELVLKTRQIVDDGRFEYEAGDAFVTQSFLAIKQSGTDAGRVTYKAGRNAEAGHAEAFWAIAHALWFEPLRRRSRVVIS